MCGDVERVAEGWVWSLLRRASPASWSGLWCWWLCWQLIAVVIAFSSSLVGTCGWDGSLLRRSSPASWSGRWRWWLCRQLDAAVVVVVVVVVVFIYSLVGKCYDAEGITEPLPYIVLWLLTSIRFLRWSPSWFRVLSASLGAV